MTRRDFGKPAFSLRKNRFVKTQALSLLGTTRLLSSGERATLKRLQRHCIYRQKNIIVNVNVNKCLHIPKKTYVIQSLHSAPKSNRR